MPSPQFGPGVASEGERFLVPLLPLGERAADGPEPCERRGQPEAAGDVGGGPAVTHTPAHGRAKVVALELEDAIPLDLTRTLKLASRAAERTSPSTPCLDAA